MHRKDSEGGENPILKETSFLAGNFEPGDEGERGRWHIETSQGTIRNHRM